jgi:AraC-like DNA-binding protein
LHTRLNVGPLHSLAVVDVPPLPVLAYDESAVPTAHAFDVYHDTTAPLFDTALVGRAEEFRVRTTDYLVDDVVVSRVEAGAHTLCRTRDHLRDGTTDWITVQIHHRGGFRGQAGRDTSIGLSPDHIGIVDLAEPFSLVSPGGVATWVAIPRHRVETSDRLGPAASVHRRSPRGRVLAAAVSGLWERLGAARADDAEVLAASITDAVNTVLDPDDFAPTDHDLGAAMQDHLSANLRDLCIGVDDLCATFHCSRSSVYRCFERHGGVASYIRAQRLLRCFEELARPASLPRRVGAVATRWGFENPSHFNRLFKAAFGVPPSALGTSIADRAAEVAHPSSAARQILDFHTWARAR